MKVKDRRNPELFTAWKKDMELAGTEVQLGVFMECGLMKPECLRGGKLKRGKFSRQAIKKIKTGEASPGMEAIGY